MFAWSPTSSWSAGLAVTASLVLTLLAAAPAAADFVGHGGMVRDVAVSADGTRVATAGFDYTARLWNFLGQGEERSYWDHEGPVNAVALLADGATMISAGDDGAVRVWDTTTGDLRLRLEGHHGKVAALAVSPDETTLATGGWDGTVRVWSLDDGRELQRFAQDAAVNAVVFADAGRTLAAGDRDGMITVWALDSGERTEAFQAHPMGITALDWDGVRLLSAGIDSMVRLWPEGERDAPVTFAGHDGPVFDAAFASGGRIVTAGRDGFVGVWSVADRQPEQWIEAHAGPVWGVAVTPDGRFAISAGSDGAARVWHVETGSRIGGEPDEETDRPTPWLTSTHPGAQLYRACASCHALSPDEPRRSGPHFAGLFGRPAGTVPGYAYSHALRHASIVWNAGTLRALFAHGPDAFLPGTKMPLQRISDPEALGQLVDYLRILTAPGQNDGSSKRERTSP